MKGSPKKGERPEELFAAALDARKDAYCPYSKFQVGAAVLASDGEIITGANVENASYGVSVCAERVAVFTAVASGKTSLDEILVVTETSPPAAPCGVCRQVLAEFLEPASKVHLSNPSGEIVTTTFGELLPRPFRRGDLGPRTRK